MSETPEGFTTVHFHLLNQNWEMLYSAAVFNSEGLQTALNRACALYETLHRAEPGEVVGWKDGNGNKRRVVVLPLRIPTPLWLRWIIPHVAVYAASDRPARTLTLPAALPLALTALFLLAAVALEIVFITRHQDAAYLALGAFFILVLAAATAMQTYLYLTTRSRP